MDDEEDATVDDDSTLEEATRDVREVGDGAEVELVEDNDGARELEVDTTIELVEKSDGVAELEGTATELVEESDGAIELEVITSDDDNDVDEITLEDAMETTEEGTTLEDC